MELLTIGNTAKLYCLNWIEAYVQNHAGAVSMLDMGCGTASNFVSLLQKYPSIRYVGIEPSQAACAQARRNLDGLNGTIFNIDGYAVHEKLGETFDLVVSFSVLEHVYQRARYLNSAKACLQPGGYVLINYDAGHFVVGTTRDQVKNVVGPLLARVGVERYYQSFVREQEFHDIVRSLGLSIIDDKYFNTQLKGVYKVIPDKHRPAYMEKWLDFELWLNELGIAYDDGKARSFVTRNFILQG
jgi:SAM-dependent methyltransferase